MRPVLLAVLLLLALLVLLPSLRDVLAALLNLRERALEVIRIYQGLIEEDAGRPESDFTFYLEDPALVTLGLCYQRKGNFSGGAYHPILRRLLEFSSEPLRQAIVVPGDRRP